jgi:hypothetical protein
MGAQAFEQEGLGPLALFARQLPERLEVERVFPWAAVPGEDAGLEPVERRQLVSSAANAGTLTPSARM